jgi:hypothetical protein
MTAEVVPSPLTLSDANRALREALESVGMHKRSHEQLRTRLDFRATARARNDLGLAALEVVNIIVAVAEAEDRLDPVWAESRNRGRPMFAAAGPGHDRCEQAWRAYQQARKTGDHGAIAVARELWRDELVDWHVQLHEQRCSEDQERAEKLSWRVDESTRLDAGDAFPAEPHSRREAVVRASRERERQESIRRANNGLRNPWVRPAPNRGPRNGSG